MRRRNGFVRAGQDQPQLFRVVAMRLDPDRGAFHRARPAPLRPTLDGCEEIVERQIPLVIRPREPFGRHPVYILAARHIHLVAAADVTPGIDNLGIHGFSPATGGRKPLSRPPNPSRAGTAPLYLSDHSAARVSSGEGARDAASRCSVSGRICVYRRSIFQSLWPVTSETCSIAKPASNRRLVPSWRRSWKWRSFTLTSTQARRKAVPTDF